MGIRKAVFSILALTTLLFGADKCILSGFVRSAASGEAIAGANVYIEGEPFGAAANIYGYYTITSVPSGGPHNLIISAIGYAPQKIQIICEGKPLRNDFELMLQAIKGKEIVVQAQRVGGMKDPYIGHMLIKSDLIRHAPVLAEPDLFRTLQMLPGITSISDFSSGLYIWGGTPSDNLILLDNIEVYNPTHLMGFFSTFIVDAVREANLVKGGYPAKWGGRLGSVLEVTNKDGNRKEFHGNAELSLLSGKVFLEGPIKNGSYVIAGRRTWIDAATALLERNDIMDENLPYYFYDLQGRFNRDLGNRDKLSFSFYCGDDVFAIEDDEDEAQSSDSMIYSENENDDFEYRWGNLTLSTQWTHIFSEKLFSHMVLAGSKFRTKLDSDADDMELNDRIGDLTLKGDMSYAYNEEHFLNFGGMVKWREVKNYFNVREFDDEGIATSTFEMNDYTGASLLAGYIQDEYSPNIQWKVQGGFRLEYATNGGYFTIGPRLSGQRLLDDKTTLRAAYGHYYQYIHLINPLEEIGIATFDSWVPCNDDLKPAVSDHFVLGMETDYLPVHISMNAYFKHMNRLIESRDEVIFNSDGDIDARFHIGTGWASGFDISIEGKIGQFAGWAGYALGFTMRKMPGKNGGEFYPPKYDRRHSFKLYTAYKPSDRVTLAASFNYGTGQPSTEPIDFEEEVLGGYKYYWPIWDDNAYHNGRLPDYHRLDLSLNWVAYTGNWKLIPYFQILNIYNRSNVLFREWDEPMYDKIEADDSCMLPFLPTFGIRAEF
ncbi:TonB-dependent receptor [bacterium]|nr:TonB-dependent receptor [bacterium]